MAEYVDMAQMRMSMADDMKQVGSSMAFAVNYILGVFLGALAGYFLGKFVFGFNETTVKIRANL